MGLFVVLVVFLLIASILNHQHRAMTEETKYKCPPHAWRWEDIKTPNGEVQGQRMVCLNCGPISKINGDGEV
jgi:hypothetical protein